jgi:hypothetical protein
MSFAVTTGALVIDGTASLGNASVTVSTFQNPLVILGSASGGTAAITLNGPSGELAIDGLTGVGTTVGSIASTSIGTRVLLGSKTLTVGGNNLSTSFGGVVSEADRW